MTRKAWSGLLVLVIAFSITGAARTEDLRVLQMNLCNSGLAGCYTGRSVATAADVIRAQAPDVVTVNEVCQADVAVLARGGPSAFRAVLDSRTGGATRCRNGDAYGIAILTRRPVSRVTGGTYATQNPNDPEQRAWLCVDTGDISACTTHLDARSTAVARSQCRYLLGTVLPAMRSPVVLAGDRRTDDGGVQNVVVSAQFGITAELRIDMQATTDHPGLLVTLTPSIDGAGR